MDRNTLAATIDLRGLTPGVYDVPQEIDKEVARLKLASLGVQMGQLSEEQRRYLASWDTGT